jgi:hypothetical protein
VTHYCRPKKIRIRLLRSLETTGIVRLTYDFRRPLEGDEAELLTSLIGWRRGSSVRTDETGQVVGCVAHPDDWAEFKKELRKRKIGKANVALLAKSECAKPEMK